jgi:hypothetical protein
VHAAAALANFSFPLDEGMDAVRAAGGVDVLLAMLQSGDAATMQAAVRATPRFQVCAASNKPLELVIYASFPSCAAA